MESQKENKNKEKRKWVITKLLLNSPYISIDDCLKRNDHFFILGLIGKYLELIGISMLIEKINIQKSKEELKFYISLFILICNNYILKQKFILHFELNDKRFNQLIKGNTRFIGQAKFNGKLKNAIIKSFNLDTKEVYVNNCYTKDGYFTSILLFKTNINKQITKDELLKIFGNDEDLKTLSNCEEEFIIPTISLNLSMLEPKKDNNDDKKLGINEKIGGEEYYPPFGWIKYDLKVWHLYDQKNNDWLSYNNKTGEWCIAYCALTGVTQKMQQIYKDDEDIKHKGSKVGFGVYCSPKPEVMESMAETISANENNYKIGFMIRVKPERIKSPSSNKDIWVLDGNKNEFRPYGILIKKV